MTLTIRPDRISSDRSTDTAIRTHDDQWMIGGPYLGPIRTVDHTTAVAAFTIIDALITIHPGGNPCPDCRTWLEAVPGLLANTAFDKIRCLYCGSTDVFETRITIDDRTQDMALECGDCHGTWAS
jgi:hypothetical protein